MVGVWVRVRARVRARARVRDRVRHGRTIQDIGNLFARTGFTAISGPGDCFCQRTIFFVTGQ